MSEKRSIQELLQIARKSVPLSRDKRTWKPLENVCRYDVISYRNSLYVVDHITFFSSERSLNIKELTLFSMESGNPCFLFETYGNFYFADEADVTEHYGLSGREFAYSLLRFGDEEMSLIFRGTMKDGRKKIRVFMSGDGGCISFVSKEGEKFLGKYGKRIKREEIQFITSNDSPVEKHRISISEQLMCQTEKSPLFAALLGFFFLFFGLLYISGKHAIIAFLAIVGSWFILNFFTLFIMWPGCALFAYFSAVAWNKESEEF